MTGTDPCRRPLRAQELPNLQRVGVLVSTTRRALGITSTELARQAEISRSCLYRIETGKRRTRRSTLARIAAALAGRSTHLDVASLLDDLTRLAGAALAEESPYAERVQRRREQRTQAQERRRAQKEARDAERWYWQQRQRQRTRYNDDYLARLSLNSHLRGRGLPEEPLPNPAEYDLPGDTVPTALQALWTGATPMRTQLSATGIEHNGAFALFERQHYIEVLARAWMRDPDRCAWGHGDAMLIVRTAIAAFDQTTRTLALDRYGNPGLSERAISKIKYKDIERLNKDAARALINLPLPSWTAYADRIDNDPNIQIGAPPWFDNNNYGQDPNIWPYWARVLVSQLNGTPPPPQPLP